MENIKNTVGWGAGLLITTAVASKAIGMITPRKRRRKMKGGKKK
jgi:hypothetical protein